MTNADSFQQATDWAYGRLESHVVDGSLIFHIDTFPKLVVEFFPGVHHVDDATYPKWVIPNETACFLFLMAKGDPEWFDCCRDICADNILVGAELPEYLCLFVQDCLRGSMIRPTPPHRERNKNWFAQLYLISAASDASRLFGLRLTRNDVSEAHSACDAVAAALNKLGRRTSYSELKNLMVHPRYDRLRREVDVCFELMDRRSAEPASGAELSKQSEIAMREVFATLPNS